MIRTAARLQVDGDVSDVLVDISVSDNGELALEVIGKNVVKIFLPKETKDEMIDTEDWEGEATIFLNK